MGKLTELVFPSYGVRFIAINDNVDSLYGENDFAPFKNLFNEFYAKDTSRKIRAVKKAQAQRGERVASRPRYGYQKADGDPKKIVPDPEAAEVVRKIFQLCVSGRGPSPNRPATEAGADPQPHQLLLPEARRRPAWPGHLTAIQLERHHNRQDAGG